MESQKEIINYFFNNLKIDNIKLLINKINETKNNIYIMGVGKNYNSALQTADLLKSLSLNCFHLDTQKLIHGDMGVINNNLILIFSKSGNTHEIVNIMDKLIERNCFLVGIFCNSDNKISKKCNLNIYLPLKKEIDQNNLIPSMSITLYSIFTNYLVENLSHDISLEEYGSNHPAGDIGKKSNLLVKDIMKKKEDCCIMFINNTIRECIINMTEKRSQCCIFLNNNKLYGIITDYDIRKYLENNDNINIPVNNIINLNPTYVNINTKLNNLNYNNLSGIPVLDNNFIFLGIVDNKSIINI